MNLRVLLFIPAVVLFFSVTGCKKDDTKKPLKFEDVLGTYKGKVVAKSSFGEFKKDGKVTLSKSGKEKVDGTLDDGIVKYDLKFTENKEGKIKFEVNGLLSSGTGYVTAKELYYKVNLVLGSEEFSGQKE